MLSILSDASSPSICAGWRRVCSGPLPIFNWIVCLPGVESWFLYIFWKSYSCPRYLWKNAFPNGWFPFYFADVSLAMMIFNYMLSYVSFLLYGPFSRGEKVKIFLCRRSEILLPMFSSRAFMMSQLIFKSFFYLKFIFVYSLSWLNGQICRKI